MSAAAQPNAASGAAVPVPEFRVEKLELKDSRATVTSVGGKPNVHENVDLEASDVSYKSQFPVQLSANLPGGGTFKLDGKIGPLNTEDASLTPLDAKVTIKGLDLAKTGFVDPRTGILGIADLENTLASKSGVAHAQGSATLTKLLLVKGGAPSSIPVLVDFIVDYNLANSTDTLTQGAIKIGKAVTHVSGTLDNKGNSVMLNLKVDGENLPVTDLEAALPAFGVVLPKGSSLKSGRASANLTVQGPADKAVTTGNVGLYNAQLAGFDVSSKMSAITKFTGGHGSTDTTIQKFTSNVRVAPDGIQANAIDAVVPAIGQVTGAGTVSNSGALNFNMVAKPQFIGCGGRSYGRHSQPAKSERTWRIDESSLRYSGVDVGSQIRSQCRRHGGRGSIGNCPANRGQRFEGCAGAGRVGRIARWEEEASEVDSKVGASFQASRGQC